jgi:hypothetical protein
LAEDMNRQAILERLGWKFARIRGSAFYRDPDKAMESVFRRLQELEILPNTVNDSSRNYQDSSLIEELKSIISNGFEKDSLDTLTQVLSSQGLNDDPLYEGVTTQSVSTAQNSPYQRDESTIVLNESNDELKKSVVNPQTNISSIFEKSSQKSSHVKLSEYSHYFGPPCIDPRVSTKDQIYEGLLSIVRAEGPVQVKRVFDIFLRSSGIKRMGHDLRDSLLNTLAHLKQKGLILGHKYTVSDDNLNETIWLNGNSNEIIRTRGDRILEEIPLGELYAISEIVVTSENVEKGSEEHLRKILEYLDLKRLTGNAESILNKAISGDFQSPKG